MLAFQYLIISDGYFQLLLLNCVTLHSFAS